ncbi:MAG: cytochrome P450 [Planctomycetes bacterium]|nr:cytochrome P450 [Planctomycetota bacterium]
MLRTATARITKKSALPITRGSFSAAAEDPLGTMRRLYEEHGEISALEDGQRVIFVFGPEFNQRVLSDAETFHSYFFPIRGPRDSAQRRLTSGLLSQNGARHREQRRLLLAPFQKRVFPAYVQRIAELTHAMLRDWRVGQTRDLHVEMNSLLLRITSSLLFGLNDSGLALELGEMIDRWGAMSQRIGLAAIIPQPQSHGRYQGLLAYAEQLETGIRRMIGLRRCDPSGDDVLSILLRSQAAGDGLTDEELIGQAALLFSAAHLTTAHSLTWTLFLLAQHPSQGRRLSEELTSDCARPALHPVESDSFLDRVIKESLRILPGSAYVQRVAMKPVSLGPFRLSRGTVVVFSQFMTHHMPTLYEQPERFHPDRWLSLRPSPYAYLPFGAGARRCMGGPLAEMIMKLVAPAIWRRFRLRVVPGSTIDANAISTMLAPLTPVRVQLHPLDAPLKASPVEGNIHRYVEMVEV